MTGRRVVLLAAGGVLVAVAGCAAAAFYALAADLRGRHWPDNPATNSDRPVTRRHRLTYYPLSAVPWPPATPGRPAGSGYDDQPYS